MKFSLRFKWLIMMGVFPAFVWGCSNSDKEKDEVLPPPVVDNKPETDPESKPEEKVWYSNPVIDSDNPDPTVIKADDGYFYLYATGGNTWIHKSKDLVKWEFVSGTYEEDKKPNWESDAGIWAPDINYINGKYVMYYSLSKWGGTSTCGIGVSVSDTPAGPFTDHGKLFRSNEIGVTNSIDPFYIEDNGRKFIFWGSWYGIWGVELSEDGLSLKGGLTDAKQNKFKIAATYNGSTEGYEGSYILKRGNYYYLFCSTGTCCEGANSTYQTLVSRSESLFGPYVNKMGENITDNPSIGKPKRPESLILKNSAFLGTGHNSEIVQDDKGQDWIIYHAYRTVDPDKGRVVLLDRVYWDSKDWPYLMKNSASVRAEAPVFK